MRQLNETFEDHEFEILKKAKGDKTWRQFLLDLIHYKVEVKYKYGQSKKEKA